MLLFLWVVVLGIVLLMPLAFPSWDSASFFSTSLVKDVQEFNFLELYIPANPFHALANNTVPAVVLFSIAVGVALIGVRNKEILNQNLTVVVEALMKVTNWVVHLAPIGVFAIAAEAAGTMNVEDFGRWQVYLVTYVAAWFLLSFWVLPVVVTSLTPLTYKEVVWFTKDALITAFATGNLLVVLPVLADKTKELVGRYGMNSKEAESAVDVIVPISFTFPSTGKLLGLSFVLFAGWFSGVAVSVAQYPNFVLSGFFSFFGAPTVAIPFLLDLLRIPADLFELFVLSDTLIGRFGVLLAAMHTLVLALLGTFAMSGRLRFQWRKLAQYGILTVIFAIASLGAVRPIVYRWGRSGLYQNTNRLSKWISWEVRCRLPSIVKHFLRRFSLSNRSQGWKSFVDVVRYESATSKTIFPMPLRMPKGSSWDLISKWLTDLRESWE